LADPRANIWFTRIGGKVVTTPTSRATTDVTLNGTTYSKPLYYQRRTSPLPMLTYTELKFIESEAQLRLGDRNKAYTAYETAVRAALAQASIFNSAVALTSTQINTYMARPKVLMGADKLTLKDIITQKYIYLNLSILYENDSINFIGETNYNDPPIKSNTALLPLDNINIHFYNFDGNIII
jgi:hypothetical protein